ncbi:uncharacterized protein [Rhodnius prolixus]|uniref:uncharacterized protein n=1 Tax=Rhodnius prolixus TaxID=13249 RepID=UPI003D18BA51
MLIMVVDVMDKELHQFLFLLMLLGSKGSWSLRLSRLVVPQYKMRGEIAILECHYELEGDNLYAVKWYKENEEFYRFVPKSNPKQVSYKVEGIKVDVSR